MNYNLVKELIFDVVNEFDVDFISKGGYGTISYSIRNYNYNFQIILNENYLKNCEDDGINGINTEIELLMHDKSVLHMIITFDNYHEILTEIKNIIKYYYNFVPYFHLDQKEDRELYIEMYLDKNFDLKLKFSNNINKNELIYPDMDFELNDVWEKIGEIGSIYQDIQFHFDKINDKIDDIKIGNKMHYIKDYLKNQPFI